MSWMAAAVVGGAVIGGVATNRAANKQAEGTDKALNEQARQFDITQANQAPYLEAGKKALSQFAAENDTPLDTSTIQMDLGYQFGLQQGQQAIDRQTAAAGGRISGAALKAAAQYGTNYATTGYSAAYGRAKQTRDDRLARLASLANIGQISTNNMSSVGQQNASANSALMVAAGNNAGAATMAQGNIWGNAGNQLAALYGRRASGAPNGYTSANQYSGGNDGWTLPNGESLGS